MAKAVFFAQKLILRKQLVNIRIVFLQRQKLIIIMKLKFTLVAIIVIVFSSLNAQEISDTKFGKGLINFTAKDSSFSVKFAPRFQVRSISSWDHDGNEYGSPEHNFIVRRARLKFDGFAYSPKLKYKIELGLSNRDISGANQFNRNTPRYILDAVIMWNFAGNWELWAGQTKLPGNVERVVSSANLQLVDRSLLNSRFNIDRDLGIQLRHKTNLGGDFLMREKFSISQGEGRNVSEGNEGGLQYTARLEFLPFGTFISKGDYSQSDLKREEKPKLMVGLTYNYNQDAVRERGFAGDYMIRTDGSLYSISLSSNFIIRSSFGIFSHKREAIVLKHCICKYCSLICFIKRAISSYHIISSKTSFSDRILVIVIGNTGHQLWCYFSFEIGLHIIPFGFKCTERQ